MKGNYMRFSALYVMVVYFNKNSSVDHIDLTELCVA